MKKEEADVVLKKLGRRCREIRIAKNMTTTSFAKKANMGQSYISEFENGKKNLNISTLENIRQTLNVTYAQMFELVDQEYKCSDKVKQGYFKYIAGDENNEK